MKALRLGLVCVTHVNKSSSVLSVGSTISSRPFRFPSHLCSLGLLGLLAQLQSCLASLFTASLKNSSVCSGDHAAPCITYFSEALWVAPGGNTMQEHRAREKMRSSVLIPEAGKCTRICVSICADVGTAPWLPPPWPRGSAARMQKPWEEATGEPLK